MKAIYPLKCEKCGSSWKGKTEFPRKCPYCHVGSWWIEVPSKCSICNKTYDKLHEHHLDGNRNNIMKSNRLQVCGYCHIAIHYGVKAVGARKGRKCRTRTYTDYNSSTNSKIIVEKINALRRYWIKNR